MTQTKAELLQTRHQGDIRLGDANSSHYVGFKAPATVGSNLVWTLPATDGSANQFLQTNASGVLGWGTADVSSAMPLTGGTFTGDVTFDGATAGRDIVFDRSDNALEFADDAKLKFGSELEIYSTGAASYIKDTGTGNLTFDVDNLIINNAADSATIAKFKEGDACELYFNNSLKFATNNTGVAITGSATVSTNLTVTGDLTVSGTTTTINTQTLDVEDKNVVIGKVSSPSDTTADGGGWTLKGASDKTFNWVNATDAWTSSEHIHLGDDKKLLTGTGSDLEIYHSSSNAASYIQNSTGNLFIEAPASAAVQLRKKGTAEVLLKAISDGAVELYHDNVKKFETTASGATIIGNLITSANLEPANNIHLADGKKLMVGASNDLQIYHDGTSNDSYIDSSAGNVYLRLNGTETSALFIKNAGARLYHNDSQKFETTSTGIDVTGAITVNGAALSSAPTITATASGSIGANTAVHLQSDGTVKTASVTAPALGSLGSIASGDSYPVGGPTVYNSSTKTIVTCFKHPSDGRPYAVAGTISGTTITWGAAAEVSDNNDFDVERMSLAIDTDDTYCLIWDQSNSPYYTRYSLFSVNGTTIGTESIGTVFTGNAEATQVFNTGVNEFMVFYKFSSWTRRRKGTRSGNSISWSGDAQLFSQDYTRGCYLAGPSRVILPLNNSGFKYRTFDVGGMSVSSESNIYVPSPTWTGNAGRFDLATVTDNQFILVWNQLYNTSGNTINQLSIKTGYMADGATSVSWGTTLDASVSGGIDNPSVHYNSTSGKCIVSYDRQNRTGRYGKEITLSSNNSGATCTVGSEFEIYYSSTTSTSNVSYELGNTVAAGDDGQDAFIFYVSNSGLKYRMRSGESSSMTAENFIGFSDGTAYTNGQTATVNIVGNQTTQSSLTPAEKYYVQNDGSLSTTATAANVYAGIALTSTKLAIKA